MARPHSDGWWLTKALLAMALTGMLAVMLGAAPAWAQFGDLVVLRGSAKVIRGSQTLTVSDRAQLLDGDRVETQAESLAYIRMAIKVYGAEAMLTSNTTVTVNELRPNQTQSPMALLFGAMRTRLLRWTGQPFVVTRTATIGIKGTDFITTVRREKATEFIGVTGEIECVSRSNPDYSIRIGVRQWGEIVEGQQPNAPVRVPDELWIPAQKEFAFPASTP